MEETENTKKEEAAPVEEKAGTGEDLQEEVFYNKKNKTKYISSVIFLIALTVLVVSLFLSFGEIQEIGKTFTKIAEGSNYWWLVGTIGVAAIYFFTYPLSLCLIGKITESKADFEDLYLIGASEHFFNGVTPFAAGGQPFQIYALHKKGDTTGKASGIILMNFIIFLVVVNIYNTASLFFFNRFVGEMDAIHPSLKWISLIGFIFNYLFLAFIIALGVSKKMADFLVKTFSWLCHFKWLKRFEPKVVEFEGYCVNVQNVVKEMGHRKKGVFCAFLLKFVSYSFNYALAFFVVKAVGVETVGWSDFFVVMMGTVFALAAVVWIPTPGGTVGIEYAFKIVLSSLLVSSMPREQISAITSTVTLLWRFLTYYLLLIASFICNAVFEGRFRRSLKNQMKELRMKISARREERKEKTDEGRK